MSYKSIWIRDVKRRQLQRQANDVFITHAYITEYDTCGGYYGGKGELGAARIASSDGFKVCAVVATAKQHGSNVTFSKLKDPNTVMVNCSECLAILSGAVRTG